MPPSISSEAEHPSKAKQVHSPYCLVLVDDAGVALVEHALHEDDASQIHTAAEESRRVEHMQV